MMGNLSWLEIASIILLAGVGLILLAMVVLAIRNPVLMKLGLRNITRRPAQTFLIILGLTLSTIIFIASLSLGDTLNYSVQRNAIDAYGEVDEVIAPPLISALAGFAEDNTAIDDPATETEENLNNLLEGGLTSALTVLEGGLFGISEERYLQLQAEAESEPLIDAVAGSILFPTIIRDVNRGQGEPLGFIFAVDSAYDQNFGLTSVDGKPVDMASLQPGVGVLFAQVANLIAAANEAGSDLGLEGFSLTDAVLAVAGGAAALTAAASGEGIDLATIDIDLATLQSLGIDTAPLEDAGIDSLNLETLGFGPERLQALGVTTTTLNLDTFGIDASGVQSTTTNLLSAINLNTLGSDIDRNLAQVGLQLRQGDIYLNRLGAEQLDAQVGDVLEVFIGPLPIRFRVRAIVEEAGPVGALLPVVMMPLEEAQKLLFMRGKVNNVLISNLGDEVEGLQYADEVSERLRVLAMDPATVENAVDILRRPQVRTILDRRAAQAEEEVVDQVEGPPPVIANLIINIAGFDELARQVKTLPAELDKTGVSDELRTLLANDGVRGWLRELDLTNQDATDLDRALRALNEFDLLAPLNKSTIVTAATVGGTVFTSVFTLFGALSILAAILLIFLIFIMLAAERRSEIGIARAIGVQRRNVVQMFVAEGLVYDLAAAALGVLIGLAVSYAMIGFIGGLFNNVVSQLGGQSSIFSFYFRTAPTSIVIAYAAGVIFTFFIVTLASWRASRLNIVAAIRDLPEEGDGGDDVSAVRLWRLLIGPVLLFAGIALLISANGQTRDAIRLGVTLAVVGLSLFAGTVLQSSPMRREQVQRLVYTSIGLTLIIVWGTPWTRWLGISDSLFEQDLTLAMISFTLTGPLVILGAILVVMFNADAWTWAINRVLGGIGVLSPVLKTAIAYPLSTRFRTGVTMLLFAMVISTVTIMSIVIDAVHTLVEPDEISTAGFEIEAGFSLLSFFDPMEDLAAEIAANPDFPQNEIAAVGGINTQFLQAQQVAGESGSERWRFTMMTGVTPGYIDQAEQVYSFSHRAAGYASDADVWRALRERDDVAIATADAVSKDGDERRGPGGGEFDGDFPSGFRLTGIDPDASTLPEVRLALRESEEATDEHTVQVIGVLAEPFTVAGMGIQTNIRALDAILGEQTNADTYYVKVREGADVDAVAAELERAFLGNALNATVMAESNAAAQAVTGGILRLFQGFLALGLLVGIAALGVISTRSVVERRQQVGMLRAIGFQSNMVAFSFLLESSFVALTGILIGVIGGVVLGQNIVSIFFNSILPDRSFPIPWLQIGIIVLAAYGFSLLTTLLPAYQASRIYPAEALRYE
ncbi:MAG: FtsX-like permease family protein [Caldilineales bacterium]|nr:FtsX-like permease family protein [Caldilineales bacterium]